MQIPLEQRHNTDGCDKCRWIRVEGWGLGCLGMAGGETASEMAPCKDTKLQEPIEGLLWDWKASVASIWHAWCHLLCQRPEEAGACRQESDVVVHQANLHRT